MTLLVKVFTFVVLNSIYLCIGSPPLIDNYESIFLDGVEIPYESALSATSRRLVRETKKEPLKYDTRSHCSSNINNQPPNRVDTSLILKALRLKLEENSFDAIIIPSSDEHQNEYVAPSDKRREFVTGFSGSSGTAVVTLHENALWTDTRYTLQADQEVDCTWHIITQSFRATTPPKWLSENLQEGSKVGGDMRLFGANEWIEVRKTLNDSKIILEDVQNLLDELWETIGRPSKGNGSIVIHDLQFSGLKWPYKVKEVRTSLKEEKMDLFVVSALDEVAWLLNLRGFDIPYNAVFRSYVILGPNDDAPVHLFVENPDDLTDMVRKHLRIDSCSANQICVRVHPYNSVRLFVEDITRREDIKKVLLSDKHPYSSGVSYYIYSAVPEDKRVLEPSPIMLRKAQKDENEARAMREAQTKDSVALVEFFAFLEKEIKNGKKYDESSVLPYLNKLRSEQDQFRGESFTPISAFGSNGAIVHYNPTDATKKDITDQSLYLLDSGGQYLDGTTDVTRTLHFGVPTTFQIEAYTRVLQGAIELATLIVPWGMKDIFIDIIARRPLYDGGLDYGHGSGHGIGLYLNVHEGPTLLGMNEGESSQIEVGQFFSDEPGYYKKNEFGIRLESILQVVNHSDYKGRWDKPMMKFEVVTLVPFEPKLIDQSMLTARQCSFLREYNSRIRRIIGRRLLMKENKEAHKWLLEKTKPLDCPNSSTELTLCFSLYIVIIVNLIPYLIL